MSKYSYSISAKNSSKTIIANSHISAVHTVIQQLIETKKMDIVQIQYLKPMSHFLMLIDVTNMNKESITDMLEDCHWAKRYSQNKFHIESNGNSYILLREWTVTRIQRFFDLVSEFVTVERIIA